ncbi:MAG: type I methionyl aminopeptidase [Candidatus Omnitrophota bacterium]
MINLRSQAEIENIAIAGEIVAAAIEKIASLIKEGITTKELDAEAESFIIKKGARPAFKGYRGFPAAICASINEEIVHGIPSNRKLRSGDLISIDLGVEKEGFYADAAMTVGVGSIKKDVQGLIEITQIALLNGIKKAQIGNRISDVSYCIQQTVRKAGFDVIREFVGHGIGTKLHEEPPIPNYGELNKGPRIKNGMVLAIEPMVCEGHWKTEILKDGWTVVTKDRKLSAHFEHTIVVTKNGPRILTLWQKKKLL